MSYVYAVRCNFSRPDLEQAWHAWYSGPKLVEMMTHPLFLSGQRYRASGLDQRVIYLAAWVVESPAAFETPQYRASWGFGFRWFSPIGPLRFEWGVPFRTLPGEQPLVFEFTIGNFF